MFSPLGFDTGVIQLRKKDTVNYVSDKPWAGSVSIDREIPE